MSLPPAFDMAAADENTLLDAAIDDVKLDEGVPCPDRDTQQGESRSRCGMVLGPEEPPFNRFCTLPYQDGTLSVCTWKVNKD
jgi:hypothetical protein